MKTETTDERIIRVLGEFAEKHQAKAAKATDTSEREREKRLHDVFAQALRLMTLEERDPSEQVFRVDYLPCDDSAWKTFGAYPTRGEALRDLEWLNSRGNMTRLRRQVIQEENPRV